ncbi:MAG: hypothetical protein ACLQNE_00245 [Thermoguttaceae bacterium]|jgi:hypothetical protein
MRHRRFLVLELSNRETWAGVDEALRDGVRGLPGGSSLARLLAGEFGVRNCADLPQLRPEKILEWADAHYRRTGNWPNRHSGIIPDSDGEKWMSVDAALGLGGRGLPDGLSLAKLLAENRGVRNRKGLPTLTEEQIVTWADVYRERTGKWPTKTSGPIPEAPGESWNAVTAALREGLRGLPGGSSLALLLAEKRGVRSVWTRPNLTIPQVLAWADAFHERSGCWPSSKSGPIPEAPGETWLAINCALGRGLRGLAEGLSLAKLMAAERDVRNRASLPRLSRKGILAWALAHHKRTGKWPTEDSGPIPDCPGETWCAVDAALRTGCRGLRGQSSLPRLLDSCGVKQNPRTVPRLSQKKILAWADAHFQRTGQWPAETSGPVQGVSGERWDLISSALRRGLRGLPGGSSLIRLLARKRGARHRLSQPPFTVQQVWKWAEHHFQRTGRWPQYNSGAISDAPGETWFKVDSAFRQGKRGLPGGLTLAKFLAGRRKEKPTTTQDRRTGATGRPDADVAMR